jgi:hypothetical protein
MKVDPAGGDERVELGRDPKWAEDPERIGMPRSQDPVEQGWWREQEGSTQRDAQRVRMIAEMASEPLI